MMTDQEQKEYDAWFNSMTKSTQQLILKYPAEKAYRVKNGAPYKISCSGTTVYIVGYRDNGEISVVVLAENKLPETKKHELELCIENGKDYETATKQNVKVQVDPKWLEAISNEA